MQHGRAAKTCSKGMLHGNAAWTWKMNMQNEHAESTSRMDMQLGIQHEHVFLVLYSTCCTNTQHGHAAWRSDVDAPWKCSFEMHLGHAARTFSRETQQVLTEWNTAWACRIGHAA